MRLALIVLALAATPAPTFAASKDLAGRYRLAEGPDVAGQLELTRDGKFGYELAAGALDERARGVWVLRKTPAGDQACLTTTPTPVAPRLAVIPVPADQTATVFVAMKGGRGLAGVNFVIGFDRGDPLDGYTQYYGWTLPPGEKRVPRWIELSEPIYGITVARTAFPRNHKFRAELVANDLGVVNFQNACFEQTPTGYVLHRRLPDGSVADMKFRAVRN